MTVHASRQTLFVPLCGGCAHSGGGPTSYRNETRFFIPRATDPHRRIFRQTYWPGNATEREYTGNNRGAPLFPARRLSRFARSSTGKLECFPVSVSAVPRARRFLFVGQFYNSAYALCLVGTIETTTIRAT